MKTRTTIFVLTAASTIACAALGTRWSDARARSRDLASQLASIRQNPMPAPTPPAQPPLQPELLGFPIADSSELEERKALLAEARAIPALARRESTSIVIRRLKALHDSVPPPPTPLPPPYPKNGSYFPELLDDPAYLRLVAEDWESTMGSLNTQRMDRLDVPKDIQAKVMTIAFDDYLASQEAQRFPRTDPIAHRAAMEENRRIHQENEQKVRALLGEETFAQYQSVEGLIAEMNTDLVTNGPLAVRLSYSDSPLTDADKQRLGTLVNRMANPPKMPAFKLWNEPEFLKQAQSILNPTQIDALRQLQEENDAKRLRSTLPKSSELPRATRRARLEGGG